MRQWWPALWDSPPFANARGDGTGVENGSRVRTRKLRRGASHTRFSDVSIYEEDVGGPLSARVRLVLPEVQWTPGK